MTISRRGWLACAALLLAAFALRACRLDARALWWDEGLTLLFARLGFVDNAVYAVRLADTNPPFYRLLVGLWTALAGSSAFAARLFSVFAGTITVAATMRLGHAWRGARLGWVAGALAAASPMLIYFSQEAKAYSLVAACGTLAAVICLRLLRRPGGKGYALLALALLVALGSHYIAIFLIAVLAAWLAYSLWRGLPASRPGAAARTGLAYLAVTLFVVVAAQIPYWALTYMGTKAVVLDQTGEFSGLRGPAQFFGTHLAEFAVGPGMATEGYRGDASIAWSAGGEVGFSPAALLYWAAAAALLALGVAGAAGVSSLYLPSLLILPLLAGFALNAAHEFFFPRFLLYCVPLFLVLAGAGWLKLWQGGSLRRAGAAGLAALTLAAWAVYLAGYYAGPGPAAQAEDWRPLAAALRGYTRPDDAAIYARGWMPGYLHAYLPPAPEPDYTLAHFSAETLEPELAALAAAHPRIWLLDYQVEQFDPRNPAGLWLGRHGALVYAEWFGDGHAALFLPAAALPPPAGEARRTDFANGLQLDWQPASFSVAPGAAFALALDWTAPPAASPPGRFTVYLHGLAVDGTLAFGRDSEPVNGLRPADTWAAGERVREWRGALLPPGLPAGVYTLQLGLYDTFTAEAIPTRAGRPALTIGRLTVR